MAVLFVSLGAAIVLSLCVGAKGISPGTVAQALTGRLSGGEAAVVLELRIPRTVLGVAAGVALGLAGALIQAVTRNPLADPGILGVNAGAGFAVILAVGPLGVASALGYVWFAFAGAVLAALAVYVLGNVGRGGGTPIRLTLAGVAFGAVVSGVGTAVTLLSPSTFDQYRFWTAGTLSGRSLEVATSVGPFLVTGVVVALLLGRRLNAMALGEDLAVTLGSRVRSTRVWSMLAITLLCGAATAAVGPIAFVGLMVPHTARWFVGPDQRWILAYTCLLAPTLLLAADVLGRIAVPPEELQVSIVTAFLGAPVLIALVRRRRVSAL